MIWVCSLSPGSLSSFLRDMEFIIASLLLTTGKVTAEESLLSRLGNKCCVIILV